MEPILLQDATIEQLESALKFQYSSKDCCTSAPSPQGPQIRAASRKEANLERLKQTINQGVRESEKAAKVRDILQAHPEFFDFLEVFESGLIR